MKNTHTTTYFLLGFGIGAAAAVLFTPKSGPAARDYLETKGRETADSLRRQGTELRERTVEAINRGKEALQAPLSNLSAAVDAGKKAYQDKVNPASNTALNV